MSKEFKVQYHGCGASYADGTLPLISKNGGCFKPTTYLFWKEPEDITNRVNTRLQLKRRRYVLPSQIKSCYHYLKQKMEKLLNEPIVIYLDNENSD